MQQELEANHPELNIEIIVVNEAGRESGNAGAASGRDLPLLQDVDIDDESAWLKWDVDWRDVVVVDANSEFVTSYNLSSYSLGRTDNYDELKDILIEATPAVAAPGDCNGDNIVDASDLGCVSDIQQRDLVLDANNTLAGDLDGNGEVNFTDFLILSTNFGQDLPSYTDGNIDLQNGVDFTDFLVLSANFGQKLEASSTDAALEQWDA